MSLQTERLLLRPWKEEDAATLYKWAKDPAVGLPAGWPPHTDVENSREIIRAVLSAPHTFAVIDRETGEPIGSVSVMPPGNGSALMENGEGEIGYWLAAPYWGKGLMTEAASEIIRYGFEELKLQKLWCGYFEGNFRSLRVQEKCGFVYDHTVKDVSCPQLEGETRTEHYSCLTAARWKALRRIREDLFSMRDESYRAFQAKLIPDVPYDRIIGIRTPALRAYAKRCPDKDAFLETLPHRYFEENNLHGFLLERISDYEACLSQVERFLPYIDNWATCDQLAPKVFARNLEKLLPCIRRWIASEKTYTVRFGLKMLMTHFLDADFSEEYLTLAASVKSGEYYINMMQAWFFATALAKQYESTLPFLAEKRLSPWVHNKTVQKAVESYRITPEQKDYLRALRIKNGR